MITAAFLNENILGHTSYLSRFAAELEKRPELGIRPIVVNALPLPAAEAGWAERTVPLLRRFGLDWHGHRWRMGVSRHIARQLRALRAREPIAAAVINTQSIGLDLGRTADGLPLLVALDATFRQLADSPWFAPNRVAGWFQPLTLGGLLRRERALFHRATLLLPWSARADGSLARDHGIPAARRRLLPPSLRPPPVSEPPPGPPRILFIGGDFTRKGGPLILECHRRLHDRCQLTVVTRSPIQAPPGVDVRQGIEAGTPDWMALWRSASLFVFPSRLETFGIVLLEALAFGAPVIASPAGAAREILENGACGRIIENYDADEWTDAISEALNQPQLYREQARRGRERFEKNYALGPNTERFAEWIRSAAEIRGAR